MTPEQRRDELVAGLSNTGEEIVYIAINHVAEVVGIEKAEKLHTPGTLAEMQEATHIQRVAGARQVTRQLKGGVAEFNRQSLLKSLKAQKFDSDGEPVRIEQQEEDQEDQEEQQEEDQEDQEEQQEEDQEDILEDQ